MADNPRNVAPDAGRDETRRRLFDLLIDAAARLRDHGGGFAEKRAHVLALAAAPTPPGPA